MDIRFFSRKGIALFIVFCSLSSANLLAEEELIKFGNFESWITRSIEESAIVGGKKQTLYEIGPKGTFDGARAYTNQGGSPWGTSNAYAKVSGVVKTNISVYPDKHGDGQCAKLCTQILKCKALGVVNITVLAPGCIFLGSLLEPVTGASDPMKKMNAGIPFKRKPKAVKFDYKYYSTGGERIRESGFGRRQTLGGKDMGKCFCVLQKRWEDADGNIHALRVGTMLQYFSQNTPDWKEGQSFDIHYGDISHESFYKKEGMGLMSGSGAYHALNSKGKIVPIQEEGWAGPDETPTHIILTFNSSYGEAYSGTIGNTLWVDNVKLVY